MPECNHPEATILNSYATSVGTQRFPPAITHQRCGVCGAERERVQQLSQQTGEPEGPPTFLPWRHRAKP
jgi:hypothetical protein